MAPDVWVGTFLWQSCQSRAAHTCSLLNHLNSFCRRMFKLSADLMQICCCTRSVILNVMVTQYTCSLNDVYCPHWLVQWSRHCSCMHIPVHSPWLPGYINVAQTLLVILTMAGLFPDRPCSDKSLTHLTPHTVITILLTIFPMKILQIFSVIFMF